MKNIFEDLRFVFNRWIKNDGYGVLAVFILRIVVNVACTVFGIVIASLVINELAGGGDASKIFINIFIIVSLYSAVSIMDKIFHMKMLTSSVYFRMGETPELLFKVSKLPFESVERKDGKQEFEKANEAIGRGNHVGVEPMIKGTSDILINTLCLMIFGIMSAKLSPVILLVLILTGSMRILRDVKNIGWMQKNQDKAYKVALDRYFLFRKCLDGKIGKDARIFDMQEWFKKKLEILHDKSMEFSKVLSQNNFYAEAIQTVSGMIRDFICYGYLIYRVSTGMEIGEFVLYLGVIGGFNGFILKTFNAIGVIVKNSIMVENYKKYLEQEEYDEGQYECDIPKADKYSYVFEDVGFQYESGVDVLKGLNLQINEGEKIALVGANGAGKTTLVKLMSGLYRPTSGRILLNGVDISKVNPKRLMEITGIVFQETRVLPYSIEKNITCKEDGEGDIERLQKSLKEAGFYDFVQKLTYRERTILTKNIDENGTELSGGQYQKLMFARAVYKDAPILILDEPTAALDPLAEADMYKKYDGLTKEKTSVFISHRLSSTQFCDRVVFLQDGVIKQNGSHEELIKEEGPYREMFNAQAHYYQEEVAVTCK